MFFNIVKKCQYRHRSDSCRCKSTLAVGTHVTVDHLTVVVRTDGDAAIDMGDNEVAVFVLLTHHFFRMILSDCLLVQNVGVGYTVDALDTGESCIFTVLIYVGRIQCECRLVELLSELPCEHDTELGRVLTAAYCSDCIVIELLVDLRDTARLCVRGTATADEYIDLFRLISLVLQHVEDNAVTERHLVIYVRKRKENIRIME